MLPVGIVAAIAVFGDSASGAYSNKGCSRQLDIKRPYEPI
jgi:hypothetical protein